MITAPCSLVFRDCREQRLLVAFNDPERGLTPSDPCYLPAYAVSFQPVDEETGEICKDHPRAFGTGFITMPDPIWHRLPELVAKVLEQAARSAAADRAEAERKFKRSATGQRQLHDQQIKAQRRGRRG